MRRLHGTRGSAALEFMLVLPIILLVLVGMLALGNYLSTRYFLTAAATNAARTCAVLHTPNRPCATAAVNAGLLPAVAARCAALTTNGTTARLPGTTVDVYTVTVDCTYSVDLGGTMLRDQGINLPALRVRGTMPVP